MNKQKRKSLEELFEQLKEVCLELLEIYDAENEAYERLRDIIGQFFS